MPVSLVPLVFASLVFASEVERLSARERPNLVFVLVDDLRWDELSCMGHPVVRTPHIDRLAREGARFRNAFATTPLCSPSRASFLTGQYTHRHGILDNTDRSAESHALETFPQLLQQTGYATAFIGKWHMGNDDSSRPGFAHWAGLAGQGTSFDPVINIDGERKQFTGHTDVLNELALDFVRRDHGKPFCLYLSHKALHPELVQHADGSVSDPAASRFLPAERHKGLYADAPVPRRLNVLDSLDGKPALRRKIAGLPPLGRETGTQDKTIRDRWRMLAGIDEGVGALLAALQETNQLDRTVFVFTSDHGYWNGEHGLSVERRLAYEEAVRIPLLIRYPAMIEPGLLIDALALSIDMAPTLLAFAGVNEPFDADGRSLLPLLRAEKPADLRTSFLIERYSDTVFPRVNDMGYRAVRTEHYKYIRYADLDGMEELYDLKLDPYEMRNVIAEPAYKEALRELSGELERLAPQDAIQNAIPRSGAK